MRRISLRLALILTTLLPVFSVSASETTQSGSSAQKLQVQAKEISWEALMPPVDPVMLEKHNAGQLTPEQVNDYIEKLGKTPGKELDKMVVRIPGFLVPLNMDKNQTATELLLVPTLGACIHVPPPPPNQTVYVRFNQGIKVTEAGYTPYWLEGMLKVEKKTSQYTDTLYSMTVETIEEYK